MFDIDSGKLLIVAVLALIVIGPKELPRVLRQFGQAVGKMRRMATEFQGQFMDAMKEADIADIRKEISEINNSAALDFHFDPVRDVQAELTGIMAPIGSVTSEATVASPMEGFNLPTALDTTATGAPSLADEGIAPVGVPESSDPVFLNGAATDAKLSDSVAKRKIFVKRRRSSFNVVRGEQATLLTGQPLTVRQRAVRAKLLSPEDAPIP